MKKKQKEERSESGERRREQKLNILMEKRAKIKERATESAKRRNR